MDGFDTITMSYLATPMPLQSVPAPDQHPHLSMVPVDQYDQRSTYDADTFVGYRRPPPLPVPLELTCAQQ